jgi:hypothetical protein
MIAFGNCAAMRKSVTGKLAAQLLRPGSGAVKASGLGLAAVKATGSDRAAGAAKAGAAGAKQVFPKVAAGFGSKNLLDKGS